MASRRMSRLLPPPGHAATARLPPYPGAGWRKTSSCALNPAEDFVRGPDFDTGHGDFALCI
jgi:hypothetical protein